MPIFAYTARNQQGKKTKGLVVAENPTLLAASLAQQGWQLLKSTLVPSQPQNFSDRFEAWQGVPVVQRIFFTQNLGVMLRGGFSIGRAMATLALQTNHRYFRRVLLSLQSDVEAGLSFSQALQKHPRVFNELFVNMIAAGEISGRLDEVLKALTTQMKKEHQLVGKVRGAMIYPIVVVLAMIGATVAMMVFVVPKLLAVFSGSNVELPLPTRMLIAISGFMQTRWYVVVGGIILIVIIFVWLSKTRRGRWWLDGVYLRLPIAGTILKKINLAKFTRNLSSMLATDIPIIQSFHIIGRTLGSAHYRQSIERSSDALKSGQSIARVLQQYPALYPPLVQQMVHVGEESGTLDEVSTELATFFEEEVDQTMSNLSTIIEPLLLLALGGGIAFIALAIMLPIYNISNTVTAS